MSDRHANTLNEIIAAATVFVILSGLWLWLFWPEVISIVSTACRGSEAAGALVTPIALALLLYNRRAALANAIVKGTGWGIAVLIAGIILYAATTWPFDYGYARQLSTIPVLVGIVLIGWGWKILKLCMPMVLLVLLAIPIGSRMYASLIIRPETYTIAATAAVLDQLPGIDISKKGTDLLVSGNRSAAIALGESNRGARLLLAYSAVGVFVVFSRIRPFVRLAVAAITAIPIVLFCNFLRFLCWGLVSIYASAQPASALPRNIGAVCSLFTAYGLFAMVCAARINLFVENEGQYQQADDREAANG